MGWRFTGISRCILALLVLAVGLTRPDGALAQAAKYEVTGFRNARFGMTEEEVRATARDTFGARDDEMTVVADAADGTALLIVHVPQLDADLGEGRVGYVFGYPSRRLIQVNVIWGEDTSPPVNGMIAAALRLKRHFLGFGWMARSVRAGVAIGNNDVLLFSGEDDRRRAVRLVIRGVRYDMVVDGVPISSPEPVTTPKLVINYIADVSDPEIRKFRRADF